MKSRVFDMFKLLILLIASGCEPSAAAPAPLSDEEVEDLPEVEEDDEDDRETPDEAGTPRPKSDASVMLTRDAGRNGSDAGTDEPLDGGSDPETDAGDAAVQRRDAATNGAADANGALVPRDAGEPIVVAPAATGNSAVDGPVASIVARCRGLSPNKVYLRALIQRLELGAIYDFEALDEPCQTETAIRPMIAGPGTVLIANVSDANIGVATSGIHAPSKSPNWSYGWIGPSNRGHQLRLPLTEQLCPSPKLFAVPESNRYFVECPDRIYDEEGQSFSMGVGVSVLAVSHGGLILGLLPIAGSAQPKVVVHMRETRLATTNIEPLYIKAARASGAGFMFVLSSNILGNSPVPDRLYFIDSKGTRSEYGVYVDLDATYRSYVGTGGRSEAALAANGTLYDMRSRVFTDEGERGIVVMRTPGVPGVVVYEDPILPEDPDLMPYRLHGLVTGP